VRTMGVVVLEVLLQHYGEVSRPGDQKLVEAFAPQCFHEAFRYRVRSWCPDGGADDADVGACEHGVEGGGELAVSVADQEPELIGVIAEVTKPTYVLSMNGQFSELQISRLTSLANCPSAEPSKESSPRRLRTQVLYWLSL
jgi:hypothetical protein